MCACVCLKDLCFDCSSSIQPGLHLMAVRLVKLEVLDFSFGQSDARRLIRPCVDCGLITGRFCDGEDFGPSGKPCLAKDKHPESGEKWGETQRTPLCSKCEDKHDKCHYCRGVSFCTPFPHQEC